MSEILAFIKTHRRDIIITAAALAASLVVMLLSGSDSWERSIDCGHAGLYRAVLRGRPCILPCRRDFCRVGFTPQVVHRAVPAARVPDFDRRGFRL